MKEDIAYLLGKKADRKKYMPSVQLINNDVAVGVELELENIEYYSSNPMYPDIFTLWKAVQDGSLRQGTEYIFDGPLKGINIVDALEIMQSFLDVYKRNGKGVSISDRCSVHVHLDVSDLDKDQLNNLIQVYYLVERVLFQYINPLRIKNNYCRALTDSSFKYSLKKLLKNESVYDTISIIKNECDKYSALNVLPVSHFGSVEFRHHHGTVEMSKVLEWINIIIAIKVTSVNYSIHDLLHLHKLEGSIALLQRIFEGTLLSDLGVLTGLEDLDILVRMGVSDLKEVHNLDELKNFNSLNARKPKSKSRTFFEGFRKKQAIDLMGE